MKEAEGANQKNEMEWNKMREKRIRRRQEERKRERGLIASLFWLKLLAHKTRGSAAGKKEKKRKKKKKTQSNIYRFPIPRTSLAGPSRQATAASAHNHQTAARRFSFSSMVFNPPSSVFSPRKTTHYNAHCASLPLYWWPRPAAAAQVLKTINGQHIAYTAGDRLLPSLVYSLLSLSQLF